MTREATVNRPGRLQAPLGAGWWAWAALVAVGLLLIGRFGHLLLGGLLIAAGFVLAAVLRLVLPGDRAGGLHIRGRQTDVAMHGLLGVAVAAATILVYLRERL